MIDGIGDPENNYIDIKRRHKHVAKMSLTLNSPIENVIGSNLHTTSDACTSSLPNMEGFTNNTLPNSFELKNNSNTC